LPGPTLAIIEVVTKPPPTELLAFPIQLSLAAPTASVQPDSVPPGPAALATTLDDLVLHLSRYVHFAIEAHASAVALWVAHTHIPLDRLGQSPVLVLTSPMKRSGKTRLLEMIESMVRDPWRILRPSEAVLFRKIDRSHPTILLDEADTIFNDARGQIEGIRAVFNAGNRQGTSVPRTVTKGKEIDLVEFDVFCPKAIAGIGGLPDTILDRAVVIPMERKSPGDPVVRLRDHVARELGGPFREAFAELIPAIEAFSVPERALPDELDDRAQDGWEPLLAIADAAGPGWGRKARRAAIAIHRSRPADEDNPGMQLLVDCRTVFRDAAFLPTGTLRARLLGLDESPWSEGKGRELTAHRLGKLLRAFNVRSERLRVNGSANPIRGYQRAAFEDAWQRYAPQLGSGTSGTSGTGGGLDHGHPGLGVPDVPHVPDPEQPRLMPWQVRDPDDDDWVIGTA
jgi:Protein of unknown function (DUF3631)